MTLAVQVNLKVFVVESQIRNYFGNELKKHPKQTSYMALDGNPWFDPVCETIA